MMAEFIGLQQPPTKKFRSGANSNESGITKINPFLFFFSANKNQNDSSSYFVHSDFEFKMLSPYDTSDTNNTQDLFNLDSDLMSTLDNTQQQTSTSSTTVPSSSSNPILNQQSINLYQQQVQPQAQPRLAYLPQARAQLSTFQTPNLQRIQTIPSSSTIVRPTNVISNGIQQQPTIYTQQQTINSSGGLNRPLYQRMPTSTQQPTIIRQQYNTTGMINMNQNVPQMGIVKVN
jgi:hypothetical protein